MVYVVGSQCPAPLYDGVTTLTHTPVQEEGSEVLQGHCNTDKDASGAQKATQGVHIVILNFRLIHTAVHRISLLMHVIYEIIIHICLCALDLIHEIQ